MWASVGSVCQVLSAAGSMSAALLGASVDDTVYWKWYFASASSACVGHSCRKTSSTPTEHGFGVTWYSTAPNAHEPTPGRTDAVRIPRKLWENSRTLLVLTDVTSTAVGTCGTGSLVETVQQELAGLLPTSLTAHTRKQYLLPCLSYSSRQARTGCRSSRGS